MKTNILRQLRNHVTFSGRARMWAEKAVKYAEADDAKNCKRATAKASYWLRRAIAIEKVHKKADPHE